jgi:hypothetical protein
VVKQFLTIWDVVLTPIYLIVLILVARWFRDRYYPKGNPLRKFFFPGLYLKFGGAIFIGLLYQFYYGGEGDTFEYFRSAQVINSSLGNSFSIWVKLLLKQSWESDPYLYTYISQLAFYEETPTHVVKAFAAFFGLFNGTTYTPIALLFALFSYSGIWAIYQTFASIYPGHERSLAIGFLFIPSTFVWGSSIFKDTICMFALGWMVYCTFRVFLNRDFRPRNLLLLVVSFYLLALVKIYILLAFLPALSIWLLLSYSRKIRSKAMRVAANLLFICTVSVAFLLLSSTFKEELNRYSLEKVATTAYVTKSWIVYASGDAGSAYDLGEFSPTLSGMLSKFPAAVTVTLYRPWLWEVKNLLMLFSALESIVFLWLTLLAFYRRGFVGFFRSIFTDPNLFFFFIFTLIFAFAVGISTGNFGTLSRYKIPCMPFFAALLLILINLPESKGVQKLSLHEKKRQKRTIPYLTRF